MKSSLIGTEFARTSCSLFSGQHLLEKHLQNVDVLQMLFIQCFHREFLVEHFIYNIYKFEKVIYN